MATKHHDFDVCVVGGGMAGLCAALASARGGARTALVQDRPVLGGNASSEVRMWICGTHGENLKETGLLEEIQLENQYRNPAGNYSIWDSVLWAKATFEPRLTLLLNCSCTGCEATGPADDRRIDKITCWQLTTQTWHHIGAKIFIDCSGDSILAEGSGARFRHGRESRDEFGEDIQPRRADRKTMGNSLLIQLRRTEEPQPFTAPSWAYRFESPDDLPHRIQGVRGTNFWWIELGGLQDTITDAEAIRDELMRTAWGVWDYIKNRAPERAESECWALEWLGSLPGKRENRRYEGPHILTQHDIRAAGRFPDTVCYGGWPMDDHHPAGMLYPGKPTLFHPAPRLYGIPFRALHSRNVRNLLFAGRNISVTHAALSSTRVMGTTSLLGQAVGTAAALAVELNVAPGSLYPQHIARLQQSLLHDDLFLPGVARQPDELTHGLTCTHPQLLAGLDRPVSVDGSAAPDAVTLPLGQAVELTWNNVRQVAGLRVVFDSNLAHTKRLPCSYPLKGDRCVVPESLVKGYRVEARDAGGAWRTVQVEENNYQRLVRVGLNLEASGIRLTPTSTWGAGAARLFSVEPLSQARLIKHVPQPRMVRWREVVAKVPAADLAPPDSGLEQPEGRKAHGA